MENTHIIWNVIDFIIPILLRTAFITCISLLLIGLWVGFYNHGGWVYNPRWGNFRGRRLVVGRLIDDRLRRMSTWWYGRRPGRMRGNNYLERRQERLSQKEFKCLPKRVMGRKLVKELNLTTEPECVICMEKISNRQHMSMPCSQKHYFHIKCSRQCLTQKCVKPTCPICRENIRNSKVL